MSKRFLTASSLICAIVLGLGLFSAPAAAQDQGYFTYVSFWAVPRGEWAAFEKQEEASKTTLEPLVADGTLVDWGNVAVRVHEEDGYTHAEWFTATSRAALLKALEVQWQTATNASYVATTKHHDLFLNSLAHGGKTSSGAAGYIRVTHWQVKPGADEALEAFVMKNIKPTLDADIENGTILMYNFDKEDIHTDAPGGYNLAMVFPNGEAIDKFFAELTASEKENPMIGQILESLTVAKEHRDTFGRVTEYEHK